MSHKHRPLSGLVALSALFAAAALLASGVVQADGVVVLRPATSGDDTQQLQAALTRCAKSRKPCDLRLAAGVFHTDLLLVSGFVGSITGSGQGRTIIEPVLDRPLRATRLPYITEPTLAQPYPFLLHFTDNSRVAISRVSFEIPAAMTTRPYDLFYAQGVTNALMAAIQVDGDERAELKLTQTSFKGADNVSFFGNNLSFAAILESELRFTPTGDATRRLEQGRFYAYNNRVYRAGNGFMVRTADGIDAFTSANLVDARLYGLYTEDLGASHYVAVRNNISADLDGIAVIQTPAGALAQPSDYLIAQNEIKVNIERDAYYPPANDGIAVVDITGEPEVFDADVSIWGNNVRVSADTLQHYTVVGAGRGDFHVIGNAARGAEPLDTGIYVELSRGVLVAANDLRAIHPRLGDVALLPTTRDCRVFEPGDTYTDAGMNNIVNGRRGPSSSLGGGPATATTAARNAARWRSLLH